MTLPISAKRETGEKHQEHAVDHHKPRVASKSAPRSRALLIEQGLELKSQQTRLSQLKPELAECRRQLEHEQHLNASLRTTITTLQNLIADKQAELEKTQATERARGDRVVKELEVAENSLNEMTTRAETLSHRLNLTQTELVEVTHQLAERQPQPETGLHRWTAAGTSDVEPRTSDQEVIRQRLTELLVQRDSALERVNRLVQERDRLKTTADDHQRTIGKLRRERDTLLKREAAAIEKYPRLLETSAATPITASPSASPSASKPIDYGGETRCDPVLGLVFTSPPHLRDDLQKISGIAGVLETKLNKLGIYTYEQIFSWDHQAISEFSKLLRFKDRLTRDDWQSQARLHYQQKYRTRAA